MLQALRNNSLQVSSEGYYKFDMEQKAGVMINNDMMCMQGTSPDRVRYLAC